MTRQVLDFLDTFFIIARGSWSQLSFLHVYHHASIFLTWWLVTVAAYDGDTYYPIIANSLIHAIMYFYYLCTSFNVRPRCVVRRRRGRLALPGSPTSRHFLASPAAGASA